MIKEKLRLLPAVGGILLVVAVVAFLIWGMPAIGEKLSANNAEAVASGGYSRLNIMFGELTTTREEYELLHEACDRFSGQTDPDAQLEVNMKLDEEGYADRLEDADSRVTVSVPATREPELVEHERIYFDGVLLVRYVSAAGSLQTVAAMPGEKADSEPVAVVQAELTAEHFADDWSWLNDLTSGAGNTVLEPVTEYAYLKAVSRYTGQLLCGTAQEDALAAGYFAESGLSAAARCAQALAIGEEAKTEIILAAAGKSELEGEYKDRLYLRFRFTGKDGEQQINLVLRLNSENRVFDVDLI